MSLLTAVVAIGVSDVSLTVMIIGAIALAGATVIMSAVPALRLPRWLRRRRAHRSTPRWSQTIVVPATQRRVVTGRAPTLPPPGTSPAGQQGTLPDGRGLTSADVNRAEAVIDRYLDTDPELLAATLSSWLAQDDRTRSARR